MESSLVRRTTRPARAGVHANAGGARARCSWRETLANQIARGWLAGALAAVTVLLEPASAAAHARLLSSKPPEGARLAESPAAIELWFNELLDDEFNAVTVYPTAELRADAASASQRNLAAAAPEVDPSDRTHLSCKLGALAPGSYVAEWQVLSRDGHTARGRLRFNVERRD